KLTFVFFFQAEDGIRDKLVTGVQTCALPISKLLARDARRSSGSAAGRTGSRAHPGRAASITAAPGAAAARARYWQTRDRTARVRSEERRVGKESGSRWLRAQ